MVLCTYQDGRTYMRKYKSGKMISEQPLFDENKYEYIKEEWFEDFESPELSKHE